MTTTTTHTGSVLANLRALTPRVRLEFHDTKALAERQASLLVRRLGSDLTEEAIATLPRLRIVRARPTTSGLSYWNGHEWIIALNAADSLRFPPDRGGISYKE